jgi:hypothetical protein
LSFHRWDLFLAAAVTAYLLLVEVVKRLLYRSGARGAR